MKTIVIVADDPDQKREFAALLRGLFPECEIRIVSRHHAALLPHGIDADKEEGRVSEFDAK
jgi:hypothetical protein